MIRKKLLIYLIIFFLVSLSKDSKLISSELLRVNTPELIEGVVAVVNDEIITFRDISLELIIQGKITKNNINIDEILNRIIEDKLIYEQVVKFKYSNSLEQNPLSVEKEFESLKKMYASEERLKEILFLLGTNIASLYERLQQKKIIYQYVSSVIYSSISYDMSELKDYYDKQSGSRNYTEEDFYLNLDQIKNNYIKEKSKQFYDDFINKLKSNSWIQIDKELLAFFENKLKEDD